MWDGQGAGLGVGTTLLLQEAEAVRWGKLPRGCSEVRNERKAQKEAKARLWWPISRKMYNPGCCRRVQIRTNPQDYPSPRPHCLAFLLSASVCWPRNPHEDRKHWSLSVSGKQQI